jgi:Arc/MetJ-type ribon-helix-helix transcriptional regulator
MNQQTSTTRAPAVSSSAAFEAIENEKTTVLIPKATAERIRKRLPKSDFKTVDEYVSYVMEQVLDDIEKREKEEEEEGKAKKKLNRWNRKEDEEEREASNVFSKEDEENVEQRLKDLGYL